MILAKPSTPLHGPHLAPRKNPSFPSSRSPQKTATPPTRAFAPTTDTNTTTTVLAPPDAPPFIILPGFGNANRDYEAPFGNPDASLVTALQRRGFSSFVVPCRRKDWFNVGKMIFTRGYWTGDCDTLPGYAWYLDRLRDTVAHARESTGSSKVILCGHSAGGWLARAFTGQLNWKDEALSSSEDDPHDAVAGIVTLGTPHTAPPPDSKQRDMTGGALRWVNARWPGAYFTPAGVKYVAVGSRAVVGDRTADRQSLQRYSYGAYRQVIGRGHGVEGDAVVPLEAALLEGSHHVVFENVLHSMSKVKTFDEPAGEGALWYGADAVVDDWLRPLFGEVEGENVN